MTTVRGILVILVLLMGGQLAFAQPPTERPAAHARRAAAVKAHGLQVTGEHLIMWFTPVLSRQQVEALVRRLDAAVAEAKRVIGTQEWQRIGDQKLTYYLVDEPSGAGQSAQGSGEGEVFIPAEFIKQEGRAPLLSFGILELVVPKRPLPFEVALNQVGPGNKMPPGVLTADHAYSIWTGIPNYLTRLVAERTGFVETGFVDYGPLATVDALCAQRLETVEPAKVLP